MLFDDNTNPKMFLIMELAKNGQIQYQRKEQDGDLLERNKDIYDTAVSKGKKIWPSKTDGDLETATRWIFYQVAKGMLYLHE